MQPVLSLTFTFMQPIFYSYHTLCLSLNTSCLCLVPSLPLLGIFLFLISIWEIHSLFQLILPPLCKHPQMLRTRFSLFSFSLSITFYIYLCCCNMFIIISRVNLITIFDFPLCPLCNLARSARDPLWMKHFGCALFHWLHWGTPMSQDILKNYSTFNIGLFFSLISGS